jgi:hypothetical protein
VAGIAAEVRFVKLRNFPYVVFYAVLDGEVLVVALAHTKRRPGYWRRRLAKP